MYNNATVAASQENKTTETDTEQKNSVGFSVITAPDRLSKKFSLNQDGDGDLVKEAGGHIIQGRLQTIWAGSISEIAETLDRLDHKQATCWGLASYSEALIVTKKMLPTYQQNNPTSPVIARDREHFSWATGAGVFMVDYDIGNTKEPIISSDGLLQALYSVCPAIEQSPHLIRPSASSFIYHEKRLLRGANGWRVLIIIQNAQDTQRAGEALFKRSWLQGFGRIDISKSGAILKRSSLLDNGVWQPERLDFCGGACCESPLTQRMQKTLVFNPDSPPLDTRIGIADLSSPEENEFRLIVDKAVEEAKPRSGKAQEVWIESRVEDGVEKGEGDEKDLREKYQRACRHDLLLGDFVLYPDNGKPITVAEILDNPDTWHNKRFADPLEPDYQNDNRIAFANLKKAGKAYIYSHAHGERRFLLSRTLTVIRIQAGERVRIVEKALELARLNYSLFRRAGELVTIGKNGEIQPVKVEEMLFYLDVLARWEKYYKKEKEWVPADAPKNVAHGMLVAGKNSQLPELVAVVTAPTLDMENNRVIDQDGYDSASKLLLMLNPEKWMGIPDYPNKNEIKQALEQLWTPFAEFPFVDNVSRGVFLNGILTACVRPSLPTAPGILIDSPVAGSGKTLLARCLSILAGEATPTAIPVPDASRDSNEEIRKSLLALAREGEQAIIFDNIVGSFSSSALCAFLTMERYQGRILGVSNMQKVPSKCLVLATGNNVTLKGDICRRFLSCRIDPKIEAPWKRRFELSPDFFCRENRLQMVAASLTIIRAGIQQGKQTGRTASFELWSDTVRQAVCLVRDFGLMGVADPVDAIDTAYQLDPETQKLSSLLSAIYAVKQDARWKTSEIVSCAEQAGELSESLRSAIFEMAGTGDSINTRIFGRWLEKNTGRIVDGLKFVRAENKQGGAVVWSVKNLTQSVR